MVTDAFMKVVDSGHRAPKLTPGQLAATIPDDLLSEWEDPVPAIWALVSGRRFDPDLLTNSDIAAVRDIAHIFYMAGKFDAVEIIEETHHDH